VHVDLYIIFLYSVLSSEEQIQQTPETRSIHLPLTRNSDGACDQ